MIIGNGMLAKAFSAYADNEDVIIFASGVANSQEFRDEEFNREHDLLLNVIKKFPEKTFVYFSTYSIYDPSIKNSPYVLHKQNLEKVITTTLTNYHIFRLPNVVGNATNRTIVNYLYQCINDNVCFALWEQATRNILDCEDVFKIVDYIVTNGLYKNKIINVASPRNTSIKEIVKMIEKISGKIAHYDLIPKGTAFDIDISLIEPIAQRLGIAFDENYTETVLRKYLHNF